MIVIGYFPCFFAFNVIFFHFDKKQIVLALALLCPLFVRSLFLSSMNKMMMMILLSEAGKEWRKISKQLKNYSNSSILRPSWLWSFFSFSTSVFTERGVREKKMQEKLLYIFHEHPCQSTLRAEEGEEEEKKQKKKKEHNQLRSVVFWQFLLFYFTSPMNSMQKVIECVPNFSEGQRKEVISWERGRDELCLACSSHRWSIRSLMLLRVSKAWHCWTSIQACRLIEPSIVTNRWWSAVS